MPKSLHSYDLYYYILLIFSLEISKIFKFMMKFKGIQVNRETTKNISCGKELKMESIIIFGASTAGRACYVLLKDRFKIKFFCDNNEKLVGQSIEGSKIISPDVLKSIEDQYERSHLAFFKQFE